MSGASFGFNGEYFLKGWNGMEPFSNMWGHFHYDPVIGRVVYSETDENGYKCEVNPESVFVKMKNCIRVAGRPYPERIIYNGPATIVFWDDGTKTVVKRAKKDKDNKYNAFCAALAIKLYGSNSTVSRYVNSGITEKE